MKLRRRFANLVFFFALWAVVFFATLVVCERTGTPTALVLRDPVVFTHAHPLLGFLSFLGILLWTSTAAVALFSSFVVAGQSTKPEVGRFLRAFGFFSLFLGLDDLFSFHEDIAERYLGIGQSVVYLSYMAALGVIAVRFRQTILRTDFWLFFTAGGLFAGSIAFDHFWNNHVLTEESLKYFGIVLWSSYLLLTAHQALTGTPSLLATFRMQRPGHG